MSLGSRHHRRAAWCVPFPNEGGGGCRTILRNATVLRVLGYACDLYLAPAPGTIFDEGDLRSKLRAWFGFDAEGIYLAEKLACSYDVAIATAWNTAAFVAECACEKKLYFVQDYEPWFYPMDDTRLAAERTYALGLRPITLGRWLSGRMTALMGASVPCCDFGVDLEVYHPDSTCESEHAVCAICQSEKPRRMTNLLLDSIRVLLAADPTLTVYLYGSVEPQLSTLPQIHNLGLLSIEDCNALYNRCLCGIVLSGSNPSRIPFEMMASGLPVVDLYRENNLYDYPDGVITLAEASPEGLASAVLDLVGNKPLLQSMHEQALSWIQTRSIEGESQAFAAMVDEYVRFGELPSAALCERTYLGSAAPIRSDCLAIARERAECLKSQQFATQLVVNAKVVSVYARFSHPIEAGSTALLAVWGEPDQSDLRWIELSREEDGLLHARRIHLPLAGRKEPTTYNFHLYLRSPEGEMQFQLGGALFVRYTGDVREKVVDIDGDGAALCLKFNERQQAISERIDGLKAKLF